MKNAGYEIIKEIDVKTSKFVLGYKDTPNCPAPFVTWEWTERGGYFWGHYHGNYLHALKDLCQRAINEIETIERYIKEK